MNEISFSLQVPSSIVESVSHRRLQSRSRPLPDCRGCQYKGDLPWQYTGEFLQTKDTLKTPHVKVGLQATYFCHTQITESQFTSQISLCISFLHLFYRPSQMARCAVHTNTFRCNIFNEKPRWLRELGGPPGIFKYSTFKWVLLK